MQADSRVHLTILEDAPALFRAAAEWILAAVCTDVSAQGKSVWVLAGGKTPQPVYELLASDPYRNRMPWNSIEFFWGDERCVPPESPASNYRMAYEAMLFKAGVPVDRIHRMLGELADPAQAALKYEAELRKTVFHRGRPSLDLVLLGLGEDGHTASLFPGVPWDKRRWVVASYVPTLGASRISMTPRLLNYSRRVVFLVSGRTKAAALSVALCNSGKGLPAGAISPRMGAVHWFVDMEAYGAAAQPE